MKKVFLLIICMIVGLTACGVTEESTNLNIGETVTTDVLEFTLESAAMSIEVNNGVYDSSQTFLPKDYNVDREKEDSDIYVEYIAPKGHTLISVQFKVKNLDRIAYEFGAGNQFIVAEYEGKKYKTEEEKNEFYQSTDTNRWNNNLGVNGFRIEPGEEIHGRTFIDVSFEPNDFSDDFNLIVEVPNAVHISDWNWGEDYQEFKYTVHNAE